MSEGCSSRVKVTRDLVRVRVRVKVRVRLRNKVRVRVTATRDLRHLGLQRGTHRAAASMASARSRVAASRSEGCRLVAGAARGTSRRRRRRDTRSRRARAAARPRRRACRIDGKIVR